MDIAPRPRPSRSAAQVLPQATDGESGPQGAPGGEPPARRPQRTAREGSRTLKDSLLGIQPKGISARRSVSIVEDKLSELRVSGKARVLYGGLIAIFLLVVAGWLASGREMLTKHTRVQSVLVTDELFGDTAPVQQFVKGPVLGYYIGLDLVILTALVVLLAGVVSYVVARRRAARKDRL